MFEKRNIQIKTGTINAIHRNSPTATLRRTTNTIRGIMHTSNNKDTTIPLTNAIPMLDNLFSKDTARTSPLLII